MTTPFTRIIVTFNEAVAPKNVYDNDNVSLGLIRCLETQGFGYAEDKDGVITGFMTEVYSLPEGVWSDDENVHDIRAKDIRNRLEAWWQKDYPESQVRRKAEDYPWYGDAGPKAPHFIIEPKEA